jgi:hypothetical protein
MNITESVPRILQIHFEQQIDLASTFLRFQEYYESPEFKGKIFTLEEYIPWYIANSKKGKESGKFTYYFDWTGFNIPSEILEPFYEGKFDPLNSKEIVLLNALEKRREDLFYLIGVFGEGKSEKHEIAHGLYYTSSGYKSDALNIINNMPQDERQKIVGHLAASAGYHPSVFDDETQAYLVSGIEKMIAKNIVDGEKLNETMKEMNSIYTQYLQR